MPPRLDQNQQPPVEVTQLETSSGGLPTAHPVNHRWFSVAVSILAVLLMLLGVGYGATLLTNPQGGQGLAPTPVPSVGPGISASERGKLSDKNTGLSSLEVDALTASTADITNLLAKAIQVSSDVSIQGGLAVQGNATVSGTMTATSFAGSGAQLTGVNASLLGGQPRSYYEGLAGTSAAIANQIASLSANAALRNNANTFTAANTFLGNMTVTGVTALGATSASSLILGAPLAATQGGTGLGSVPARGVLYGQGGATLATAVPAAAGQCLVSGTTDVQWGSCAAAGAVTSLNGQTGPLTLANATAAAGTITINDATTATKGIASFNNTNFSVAAGVVNTIQDIATGSSPTFAGLSLSADLTVANGGTGASTLTTNGVVIGQGAAALTTVSAGGSGLCLMSTAGAPSFQACPGGGAVTSVNGESGAVAIANATAAAGTITINDATTAAKGIASFSGTNFTASAGIINTVQNISSTSAPSFAGVALTGVGTALSVTNDATIGGTLGITGNLTTSALLTANAASLTTSLNVGGTTTTNALSVTNNAGIGGTLSVTGAGGIMIGNASTIGQLAFRDGSSIFGLMFQPAILSANRTINIPNADGTLAVSASGNIALSGTGNITFTGTLPVANGGTGLASYTTGDLLYASGPAVIGSLADVAVGSCLVSGGVGAAPAWAACPGASGVMSVNGQSGALTLANATAAAGTITINDATTAAKGIASFNNTNFTVTAGAVNTIQDIGTGNSPTFASVNTNSITPSSALTIGAAAQQISLQGNAASTFAATDAGNTTTLGFATPTANTTINLPALGGGTFTLCTTSGNCAGAGGGVTTGGGTTNALSKFTGAQTIGDSIISDNGSIVTVAGAGVIQGSGGLTLGVSSSANGQIVFRNATNANTTTLQSGAAGSNLTFTLPVADGSAGDCLTTNASGVLSFTACLSGAGPGGGVTSLNGLSGALSVANASGSGATVTIDDASTAQKGIAQFNATNFTASSGTINTIQNIASTAAPSFSGMTLTGAGTALSVTNNAGIGGSLNVSGSGGLTIGSATQVGQLALRDGSSAFASTFQLSGALSSGRTINVPTVDGTLAVSASGNIALSGTGNITFTGTLPAASGGTGLSSYTVGDLLYATGATSLGSLADVASGSCLVSGGIGVAPAWGSCAGTSGITSPGGTTNTIPKFTSGSVIGDSSITDDGTTVATSGSLHVNGDTVLGDATSDRLTINSQLLGGAPLVFQGATDNGFATTIQVADPTANRTITFANASGTIALQTSGSAQNGLSAFVQGGSSWATAANLGTADNNDLNLLTNSATRLTVNTNGDLVFASGAGNFNQSASTGTFATGSGAVNLNGSTNLGDGTADLITFNGIIQGSNPLAFEGSSADANETTFTITNPTADRTITFPDDDGTVCLQNAVSCGFAASSGSTNYIQNGLTTQTANFNIQSAASGSVGAVIQGASGQTADIFQIKTSAGTKTAYLDASGNFHLAGILDAGSTAFVVKSGERVLAASGDILQVRDTYDATTLSKFDSSGGIVSYGTNNTFLALATPTQTTASTGSSYYYVVTATNATSETVKSNAVGMATNTGTITWSQVSGATGYKLYRNTSNAFGSGSLLLATINNGTTVSYVDTGNATIAGLPPTTPSGTKLTLQSWQNQGSANLLQLQDATGAITSNVNALGQAGFGISNTGGVQVSIKTNGSSDVGQVIQGVNTQAADLLQMRDINANVNASFNATGAQLTLGRIASSGTVTQGKLIMSDGTTDNYGVTLQSNTLTANRTYSFPDSSSSTDTVCLQTLANCGGGAGSYIQNQNASAQTSANFWIDGSGRVDGDLTVKGNTLLQPTADATNAFEIKSSTGVTGLIVDTTATTAPKIAVGAYTAGSTGGQFEITPYGLNRSGLVINGYNSGGSYGGNYIEVNSTYNPANPDIFRLQYNGTIAFSGGVLSTFGKTTASTSSTAMILRSGNVSGATSNSGTTTLQSGDSSTSGNTGIVTVTSGAATSGNSGNIVVDSGTASGTKGSITIGTANAPTVTIGNNSNTNNTVNIAAGTTGGINLQAKTTVTGDLIVSNNNASITGTSTGNTKLSVGGTVNASNTGSQYGIQNDVSFNPSGASLSNIYGMSNSTTVSGSALNIGQVSGIQTDVRTGAGYTGTITEATGMWVGQPVLSGTNKIATYNGVKISGNTDNGGNTTGTIENNQLRIGGNSTAAGVGGTLNNYGINLTLGSGNTSGTNNYGLYIQGSGGGSANSNYAIYSSSSAASLLTGALNINGSVALGDATADLVSINGTIQGTSVFTFEGSGADANETILQVTNPTADHIITLPDATGTICLTTTCAAGTSASFIQNQNASAQTSTNYWISGTGQADTALQSPLIDTATGVALAIGTTNATAINLNQNTVLAAGKSLKVTGGNTASRPGSPTEGMVYYDTDTHQLLTYNNSKWVADRTDAIIVAASNSSQSDKDAADYVADGNTGAAGDGDQVQINSALTAASGKKVVLLAGTYTADATILIPNNTTLAGVGVGSLIQLADIDATDNLIENSDTTTGAGITIRDLKLDGQQSLQTGTITQYGMYLYHIGNQAAGRVGARISNVYVSDIRDAGIYFDASENNVVSNSTLYSIDAGGTAPVGIYNDSSSNNSFTNNTFLANYWGLRLDGSGTRNTTVTGNIFRGSTNKALFQFGATHSTITGNTFDSNTDALILYSNGDSAVSGNTFNANTGYSITLDDSSSNTITDNRIQNSGNTTDNNAIYVLNNSDSNTITDNTITDSSAVTTNYAIRIASAGSNTNYLSSNSLGSGTINDSGTGTVYGGQSQAANGDFLFRGANSTTAFLVQNANGTSTYLNVDSSTNAVTLANGTINLNASSNNTTNINTGTSTGAVNIGTGTGVKTITIGNAVNNTAVNIQAGSGTGAITMGTGGNTNFTIDTVGRAIFQATTVDNANFQVKNHDGTVIYYNVDETIGQNKFNGTVCIIGAGGCTQGTNSILTVQGGTFIGSGGSNTTLVTPATSYNLDARLVLDNLSYAANKSGVALGMLSTSDPSARGIIIADARATTDNNPTIGIYSPDESSSAGLGWDGSNTTFKLKTQSLNTSSSNLTITSGNTNGSGTATGNVSILSGFGNGTNNSSGNIIIDSGAKTGTGTTGAITIAPTNASSITIGRATGTPPSLTLQGGSSVSLASSNGTNSTTLGFTGSQAAGDITYNLDRTVAAGPYTICTTAVSSCGGTTGTYVALQGSFPGTTQTGTINVENIRANYIETTGLVPNVADGTNLYIEGTAQSATYDQNAGSFDLTVSPSGASSRQYNAVNGYVISTSGNVSNAVLQGVQGYVEYAAVSDTLGYAAGGNFQINNSNNGTIDYADALTAGVNNNSGGTIGVATGLTIQGAINPSGTITTNTGIYINNQTAGTTDYGLYVEGADTYALYVNSGASRFQGSTIIATNSNNALKVETSGGTGLLVANTNTMQVDITGNAYIGGITTLVGATSINATGTATTTIGSSAAGAVNIGSGGDVTLTSNTSSTGTIVKSATNSTAAFQVQNASSVSLLLVDSTTARLYVGPTAGDTVGTLLVLGNKTNAGDPTGVEGGMYFNSSMKQFRCYSDSTWRACNAPSSLSWGVNFFDDFLDNNLDGNHWGEDTAGAGSGITWPIPDVAYRPGQLSIETGTTSTGRDILWSSGNGDYFIGGGEEMEFAINLPTLADGSNDYVMRAGLCESATADCDNGVYIEYDRSTSTNWRFATAKGGTRTKTTSGTAVSTGWHRFKIVVNSAGNSISYYMDGVSLGSAITTNIPDSNSYYTQQYFGIRKTAGTTNRTMIVDYFQYRGNLSSPR